MTEPTKTTIYQFRDNLSEDLLGLQRGFLCAEETIEKLILEGQSLTIQRECSLYSPVFDEGEITHFTAQRQLLLLSDKLAEINALFKCGKLGMLKDETLKYRAF
jgi:hypothetical protein